MKNMTKRIRTLLALGVMTVATASTIVPVNALSQDTLKNYTAKDSLSVCINGVNRKLPLNNNCDNKFTMPEHKVLSKFTLPECNITNNNKDNTTVEKPVVKPDENKDNTTVEKPVVKPDENKDNTTVEKPVVKPDENKDNTTVEKPVVKPDENTDNTAGNFSAFQKEVTDLVNVERTNRGLKPLKLDAELSSVATKKSEDMVNKKYFAHNSPTYGSPFDMMKQFGISYRSAGENIAMGQENPKEVVNSWMNSQGHRENILNPDFTNIGVGIAKDSNGSIYWTQMFVGR